MTCLSLSPTPGPHVKSRNRLSAPASRLRTGVRLALGLAALALFALGLGQQGGDPTMMPYSHVALVAIAAGLGALVVASA